MKKTTRQRKPKSLPTLIRLSVATAGMTLILFMSIFVAAPAYADGTSTECTYEQALQYMDGLDVIVNATLDILFESNDVDEMMNAYYNFSDYADMVYECIESI